MNKKGKTKKIGKSIYCTEKKRDRKKWAGMDVTEWGTGEEKGQWDAYRKEQ